MVQTGPVVSSIASVTSFNLLFCLDLELIAFTLTLTSYVESIKQVEILFALVMGCMVFRKRARVWTILLGSLTMLVGITLLKLSS